MRDWLQKHYIDENKTMQECADLIGINKRNLAYYITKYGLTKMEKGRYKNNRFNKRIGLKYSDEWKKNIKLGQPHAKKVVRISNKGERKYYNNITEAARENGLFRENVRACCYGRHHTAGGYKFAFFKSYGEEIIDRLWNLDFSLPIEKMMDKVYTNLPERMSKEEAARYYSKKLKTYWSAA